MRFVLDGHPYVSPNVLIAPVAGDRGAEASGEAPLASRAPRAPHGNAPHGSAAADLDLLGQLSDRQLAVLKLIAAGKSNKQVADELDLRVGTVKVYVHNIIRTLGVRNRTAAAIVYLRTVANPR